MQVDHVAIAGPDLDAMRQAFETVGLKTMYGGEHTGGVTHMALVGFDDGSYIELISLVDPNRTDTPFWRDFILSSAGPCWWAARSTDIEVEVKRVRALDISVVGPTTYSRNRPDGTQIRWKLAVLGDRPIGTVLPFLIQDETPRTLRVNPTQNVASSDLFGIAAVVIGVSELDQTIDLFRRVYGWATPLRFEDAQFEARLAHFPDTPVILAAPLRANDWVARRIARFGEAPVAYLIGTRDFKKACTQIELDGSNSWFERRIVWFDPKKIQGVRLGLIG